MTFPEALKLACLSSAIELGTDIRKISWLMRDQPRGGPGDRDDADAESDDDAPGDRTAA